MPLILVFIVIIINYVNLITMLYKLLNIEKNTVWIFDCDDQKNVSKEK